jgi:diaminohydroxyphosphoribosylaminopyrimidine deaminase / 5-amino-6-(5-phosphoribosylamino)uracil reductase
LRLKRIGISADDENYMRRAFDLAARGTGAVSPNPLVGCVIVQNGVVIGEGWHEKFGEAHAEVNAVNSVTEKKLIAGSTVYVTLEPCSHFGKTPPCADMLIREKVGRVVIASYDSNPLVSGKGIDKLRQAGIEVTTGVLEAQGRRFNRRFFTFIEKKRPYIILKWAQTADGFIAPSNPGFTWITNEFSRQLVHKWRAEEDAILVGTKTAVTDNPQLNVREWTGRNPLRIVIDRNLSLPKALKVFDHTQKTICYNNKVTTNEGNNQFVRIAGENLVDGILDHLYQAKIQSLIIEGGTETINHFLQKNRWDEARVFFSKTKFGSGIKAPVISSPSSSSTDISGDALHFYQNDQ